MYVPELLRPLLLCASLPAATLPQPCRNPAASPDAAPSLPGLAPSERIVYQAVSSTTCRGVSGPTGLKTAGEAAGGGERAARQLLTAAAGPAAEHYGTHLNPHN